MVDRVFTNPDAANPDPDAEAAANATAEAAIDKQDEELAKQHASTEPKDEIAERPENVPEKFWDAEKGEVRLDAVLKANAELEKKLGAPKEPEAEESQTDSSSTDSSQETAASVLQNAEEAFARNGELSDDDYTQLEKVGYTRELVDKYIAGQEALANSVTQAAYSHAGGEESYKSMLNWGIENLTDEEISAFDLQVQNPDLREHAIKQMFSRYQAEADVEPDLVGGHGGGDSGDIFKSSKEMIAVMSSREYKTDPNIQAEVQRKIARSEKAGIRLFG